MIKTLKDERTGAFPTPRQLLLLRAIFGRGDVLFHAFNDWKKSVNIETDIDPGSYRLLPMLYHSLKTNGIEDPLLGKLKGIYKQTWVKNNFLFITSKHILLLLEKHGINTLVLKGAAMALHYYQDFGLRSMQDFDILIPVQHRKEAINLLLKNGFYPVLLSKSRLSESFLTIQHSWGFINPAKQNIDLHWHTMYECLTLEANDFFWNGAEDLTVFGVNTKTLNASDQIVHICAHGISGNVVPPIRWIADTIMIIEKSGDTIDWDRIVLIAQKYNLNLILHKSLTYLYETFYENIPVAFLDKLSRLPVKHYMVWEWKIRTRPVTSFGDALHMINRYFRYQGQMDDPHLLRLPFFPLGLFTFAYYVSAQKSFLTFVWWMIKKTIKRSIRLFHHINKIILKKRRIL